MNASSYQVHLEARFVISDFSSCYRMYDYHVDFELVLGSFLEVLLNLDDFFLNVYLSVRIALIFRIVQIVQQFEMAEELLSLNMIELFAELALKVGP